MKKIILASNNSGKIREFNSMLAGMYEVVSMHEMQVEEVPETGLTFVENALIKARNASAQSSLPALADDSGIVVDALNGAPGIYSARYAGEGASDEDNLNKLIEAIRPFNETDRKARFVCVMVFLKHAEDPTPIISQGIWDGIVMTETAGENGFGYDPMFYVPTHNCMSAELSPDIKNQISHRGQALQCLVKQLRL